MGISQLISLKTGSSLQPKFRFLRFLGVNHQILYRPYLIHLLRWLETVRKVLRQAYYKQLLTVSFSLLSVFTKLLEKLTCLTRDNLFLVNGFDFPLTSQLNMQIFRSQKYHKL